MTQKILKDDKIYDKQEFKLEDDLVSLFEKNYNFIISNNSLFIKIEKQLKSSNSKNFKDSIGDGFLLVWDNPLSPTLYITEVELSKHDVNKHILPQLGNFLTFIQSATKDDLNKIKKNIYDEIKKSDNIFKKLQNDSNKEVYKLLEDALFNDIEILLVIDHIEPALSIGLTYIEKTININIRKIEISLFKSNNEEIIFFSDSDVTEDSNNLTINEIESEEYSLDFHIDKKPENIKEIINNIISYLEKKGLEYHAMKKYIGFYKNNSMIFSCVVRKNSIIVYSKINIKEIDPQVYGLSQVRDVKDVGHYTNHLPTEIVINNISQLENLKNYFNVVCDKF
jgi:hypothetical protein